MTQNRNVLVVSTSIVQNDHVLMIQENKPSVRHTWNFPGGRIEAGEPILDAARREVKEETGYDVILTGSTGIYQFKTSANTPIILFHVIGEICGGSLTLPDHEISGSKWVRISDLLVPGLHHLREEHVIRKMAENLLHGTMYPLTLYQQMM